MDLHKSATEKKKVKRKRKGDNIVNVKMKLEM